jgi:glutamyl-tRNA synthetase
MKVRFAPSPTGYLHVGNVRTALMNWLFAAKNGGSFLLRIDDTDQERSRDEYETAIREDLSWLGLQWDAEDRQSARMHRYAEAKQQLIESGRLYPCYETSEELEIRRKLQVSRGQPPIYDRAALKLTDEQKQEYEAEGRTPHWRFLLNDEPIVWQDMVRGEVRFEGRHVSDPVLIRADGVPLYTLSSVVDDGDMNITHIIRGEDHVSNSAVQVQLFQALGFNVPEFAHTALLTLKGGKLSKRAGGGDVRSLREQGIFPLTICSYLAKIGTSDAIELSDSMQALSESFEFAKLGRSAAMFDEEELRRLNSRLLHELDYSDVKDWLSEHDVDISEEFWQRIQPNIMALDEVQVWKELINEPITPVIEDAEYTSKAAELLPEGEWGEESWKEFTSRVREETGRKGKQLFMPLRLALTARSDGPELPVVFKLLGREKARKRLLGEAA